MAPSWKFGDCTIEGIQSQNPSGHRHLKINVNDNTDDNSSLQSSSVRVPTVYLGETVHYDVVIRKPDSASAELCWKNLVSKISCQVLLVPVTDVRVEHTDHHQRRCASDRVSAMHQSQEGDGQENGIQCTLHSTFTGNASMGKDSLSDSEPYFRDDETFVFPMSSSLRGFTGTFRYVEVRVTLSLYSLNSGKWLDSSPENETDPSEANEESGEEIDIFEEMGKKNKTQSLEHNVSNQTKLVSSSQAKNGNKVEGVKHEPGGIHSVVEKTVTQRIKVERLPYVTVKTASAGPKHFVLLSVGNHTERQVVIKSMDLLSRSSAFVGDSHGEFGDGLSKSWESCHHLASLEHPRKSAAFPAMLSPIEELSLMYRLHLSPTTSDVEYSLRCSIKWTHAGATREITSIFTLPIIKVRHPLFIVTARCEEEPEIHKTFSVTYNISNQLYDFMSMKLYYNVDNMRKAIAEKASVSDDEKLKVTKLKDAVVCHDPVVHTSCCPKGSSIPVSVSFQIHQPGLYEMNELMKVNLGYSLFDTSPDPNSSRSDSTDTISSSLSTEEQLAASRQLWQNRSGSSASLINTTTDEKRKKFAGKSYSFGDLGPSGSSTDVREGPSGRPRTFKRSSAVPPPRPPPPRKLSQVEQDLINPTNFLKTPFYIYIKESATTL